MSSAQLRSGISLRQRLLALAGLVAIVGGLFAAGLLGNQGGGEGIERVTLLTTAQPNAASSLAVGPEAGKLAPDFEISDFDGVRHRLSDFRGRPVYLNFWGTFCLPCLVELPDIYALHQRHGDGLVVIEVNRREPLSKARDYFRKLPRSDGGTGVSFTLNAMDPDDTLYEAYVRLCCPPPMPASFFIDAGGVVTRVYNGAIDLARMEAAVAEALASEPPRS